MKQRSDSRSAFRLAIVATHPVQYHTPWYQAMELHPQLDPLVLYCHRASVDDQSKAGFGVQFDWDIPLLEGHSYRFLKNVAARPGFHFRGIDVPEVASVIESGNFDAVLIQGWHFKAAWQTVLACRSAGIPVMVRGDSQLRGSRSLLRRGLKWLPYRVFVPRLDACIAVGTRSREYFQHYGARSDRIFQIRHTIGEHWFGDLPSDQRKADLRRQFDVPRRSVVFLFAGKLEPKKRPLDFLGAVAGLPREDATAVVVGDGPLRAECEDFVGRAGLAVRFLGFVNQSRMADTYALGDVLVLPSDGGETWGMVVIEAMARGLPCLVSEEVGSVPDLVIGGQTGASFPVGEVGALVGKMRDCLEQPEKWSVMGRRARSLAESYQPEAATEETVQALVSLDRLRR